MLFSEIFMRKLMLSMTERLGQEDMLVAAGDFMPDFSKKKYLGAYCA
jgi:hypothetical protein